VRTTFLADDGSLIAKARGQSRPIRPRETGELFGRRMRGVTRAVIAVQPTPLMPRGPQYVSCLRRRHGNRQTFEPPKVAMNGPLNVSIQRDMLEAVQEGGYGDFGLHSCEVSA
jgi:hypothetical protein